jgi:uncharacterized membrane protein
MPTATVPQQQSPQRAVSKHRVDALSDGVFAIVMTLLVLELKIPDLPRAAGVAEIGKALVHEGPVFFSFVITFMFASLFWYLHHVLLNFVREFKPRLVVLNLAFLMFVALLPFSVGMLGHFLRNPLVQTAYFANQFFIGAALLLLWRAANSAKVIVDSDPTDRRAFGIRLISLPIGALAAIVTAWANPTFSFYAFMMVMIASRVYTRRVQHAK